jgi:hypothetical protein
MRTVRSVALIAVGLLIASCGGGTADDTTVSTAATATSAPDSAVETTTAAAPTTTAPESTTTAATETTTTSVSGGSAGFQELLVRIDQAGDPASARVEGSMEIVGAASLDGPLEITVPFSAAYDADSGNSSFSMDMSAMADVAADGSDEDMSGMVGFMGDIEVREIGDTSYIRFGFFNQMLGAETEWVSMPQEEGEAFSNDMAAIPTSPNSMLDSYRDADAEVEELGRENVNGVEATHYLVTLDAAAYLASLTEAERAELEETSPLPDADLPMDLWISDQGHIVRMVMEIDGSAMEAASPEDDFERMTFTYDIFDIGEPVSIEAPPASDVTAVDGLMGGFGIDG